MKIDRLFGIVHILLNKRKTTAKKLAEHFEVSTRTIYRDIDTLSISGIPIYTDKGINGGISILEDFVLNKSLISDDERNSIIMGLEALKETDYDCSDGALYKLSKFFDSNVNEFIEIDFSGFDNDRQKVIFEKLKMSINKSFKIEILYNNMNKEKSIRIVAPLKLIYKKQRWYLVAFCFKRRDYRTFRISRIMDIKVKEEVFTRSDYDISDYKLTAIGNNNIETIKLFLKNKAFDRIEEEFQEKYFSFIEDGNILVEFNSEIDDWLISYIMSYGEYLIDIYPANLKSSVKNKAKKIIEL